MGERGPLAREPRRTGDPNATVPKPPADLDAERKKIFVMLAKDLISRRAYREIDAESIARYCRTLQEAALARAELAYWQQPARIRTSAGIRAIERWNRVRIQCENAATAAGKIVGADPVTRARLPRSPDEENPGAPEPASGGITAPPSASLRAAG